MVRASVSYAALLLVTSTPMVARAEPSPVPTRFAAYIGGFAAPSFRIELRHDGTLAYTALDRRQTSTRATIRPTTAQWREFRQTLDDLKAWEWHSRYRSEGVVDGTQWSLDIAYADRELKTDGDNGYPDANREPTGKPESTETFKHYLTAVRKLTGGKDFE